MPDPVPRWLETKVDTLDDAVTHARFDTRKESYANMNDWLNTLVSKRIAQAKAGPGELSEEMAWVSEHGHSVYQRRFKPLVLLVLGLCVYGIAQTQDPIALLATVLLMYFYIDFYSGVLHVVLDNPRFIRLPIIGVPCVEFQWHHTFPYDISTRGLLDVWGDLNVLLIAKSLFLFGLCGFTPTTFMVAGVGYSFGYLNQFSHRLAHTAPRRRPKFAAWLQQHRILLSPAVHQTHHVDYDRAFPVLNGHSRGIIERMLRVVDNGFWWLGLFVLLTAFDLVAVVWLIDRFRPL